jgi:hypothetical protein
LRSKFVDVTEAEQKAAQASARITRKPKLSG